MAELIELVIKFLRGNSELIAALGTMLTGIGTLLLGWNIWRSYRTKNSTKEKA